MKNVKNVLKGGLLLGFLMVAGFLAFQTIGSNDSSASGQMIVQTQTSEMDYIAVSNDKCGGDKSKGEKADKKESKCGEGKSSEEKAKKSDKSETKEADKKESKCGEGTSGDDKAKDADKAKESKCGEGKCGEGKCG